MKTTLANAPVTPRTWWLLIVAQMEQTIINVLTMAVGVMIPMLKLLDLQTRGTEPSSLMLGIVACAGLTGVTVGAPLLGRLGDRYGYLPYFRLCAVLITAGALGAWLIDGPLWLTALFLFVIGLGVGGGYSMDDVYLSELMPKRCRLRMIGIAKSIAATSACWGGLLVVAVLAIWPAYTCWRYAIMTVALLGLVTLIMRIRWWESPKWLVMHGRQAEADAAAQHFMGPDTVAAPAPAQPVKALPMSVMFKGKALWKVVATSIPWALDGVGSYGMGTFLPLILMGLGMHGGGHGTEAVQHSALLSSFINLFTAVGFIVGLLVMKRIYHIRIMALGFAGATIGIVLVLCAHVAVWPLWAGIAAFAFFEAALSFGPGLITFVLPAEVYSPEERGAGSGISAAVGKTGAIASVFLMPTIMKHWGVDGALIVCAVCMVLGGFVIMLAGPHALPRNNNQRS